MVSPKTKKIVASIASAITGIVIIAGGLFIYYQAPAIFSNIPFLSSNNSSDDTGLGDTEIFSRRLLEDAVVNFVVNEDGSIRYYKKDDGTVYKTDLSGSQSTILDDFVLNNLSSVEWSSTNPVVITKVDNLWYTFNYALGQSASFPEGTRTAGFLGNGQVYYLQPKESLFELIVADPDLTNPNVILSLLSDEVVLKSVPNTNRLSQTSIPSAYDPSPLRIIDINTKEASALQVVSYGLNVSWAPSGEVGIASATTTQGGSDLQLVLIDSIGSPIEIIPNTSTVIDKVVWSKDSQRLYYTKPLVSRTSILPDDYYEGKTGPFVESLYKLDFTTGENILLSANIGEVDSTNLQITPNEDAIFFQNKLDSTIHVVDLP